MGESRNAYRVLVGRPEGKRPLGRPRRRWEDNIKMDLREVGYDRDWINRWRAYVRAAMNLRAMGALAFGNYLEEFLRKPEKLRAIYALLIGVNLEIYHISKDKWNEVYIGMIIYALLEMTVNLMLVISAYKWNKSKALDIKNKSEALILCKWHVNPTFALVSAIRMVLSCITLSVVSYIVYNWPLSREVEQMEQNPQQPPLQNENDENVEQGDQNIIGSIRVILGRLAPFFTWITRRNDYQQLEEQQDVENQDDDAQQDQQIQS
ncbi:hypothetical protein ANN_09974 [Periplaneta americana]|uniref:Uncharacterized protein n=1 Tax=Periplaneta americana TaxID=6978 RepID=A0ABQ8TQT1_PERAM|nr:hypothetical protein ANN_09974 [Periplaneta americana]